MPFKLTCRSPSRALAKRPFPLYRETDDDASQRRAIYLLLLVAASGPAMVCDVLNLQNRNASTEPQPHGLRFFIGPGFFHGSEIGLNSYHPDEFETRSTEERRQ